MANRRTPVDDGHTLGSSRSQNRTDELQDTLSSSSSIPTSFHPTSTTVAAVTTDDRQWYPDSQLSTSFYDPAQVSGFVNQQAVDVWDSQFAGTGIQAGQYFTQQHQQQQMYRQPYPFEGSSTTPYSFPQQAHSHVQRQQQSQQPPQRRPMVPTPRAHEGAVSSVYYRQGGTESQQHQYTQVPLAQPPSATHAQIPSSQPVSQQHQGETQTLQQPTGHALAAQRTSQLIAQGQFPEVQAEQDYIMQQGQSRFPPPPIQTQFRAQRTQFSSSQAQQFPQTQPSVQAESRFSHGQGHLQSHAHAQPQLHAHIQTHTRTHAPLQPHAQGPAPSVPPQSQHYPSSDTYYLLNEAQSIHYAVGAQGSQSLPSLHSTRAPIPPVHAANTHSMSPPSPSPFSTFGPHSPPSNIHTPSSDGGMLGLSRSHDSPASYASCPTTSSFEDSSSGRPASSGNSMTNVNIHTQGVGHAPSSSVSTVTPGSPSIVATQQQQQHVQTHQRPIMPTISAIPAVQAGPARPPIAPKPPTHLPVIESRRPRPVKRQRPTTSQGGGDGGGSDDDSDGDDVAESGVPAGLSGLAGQRKAGACTHCKRMKMKCDFPDGASTCKRCATGGHPCIVEGRKPRTAPNKREYLLAQIRHKDQIIESLLKQLHNPYLATPLSIASYKAATSPSDSDNMNVVDWLDRLQASIKQPATADPNFLRNLRNPPGIPMDESEDDDLDVDEDSADEGIVEKVRDTLPDVAVPIGLLANLSLDKDKDKGKGRNRGGNSSASGSSANIENDDHNVGVANKEYFLPGPASNLNIRKTLVEQHTPEIVVHGLVNNNDVERLFEIFWKQINPFTGLLDSTLHTSQTIFQRCPFLFTVICAISSRYYKEKSQIYPLAMHFAKHSAANALIDGWKSVELCQAYILMSIYAVPARRWEEDKSWLYTGLAVRIATDLNLHQVSTTKPQTEREEREMLNRTRVWMICFNIDRSTATQFGKPSTIKEDYIIRHSTDWYKQSRYRDKFDIHLCAYSTLLCIVGRFHDDIFSDPGSPTGLNKGINFLQVTLEHDRHLTAYFEEWSRRFNEESDHRDAGSLFRCTLLPFLVSYSRLVMYSFGFQHAFQRGIGTSDNVFLDKCFDSAKVVIKHMIEVLVPSGLMRSAPDGHFVFASFASAFMLKLLRPEFAQLLTRQMEDEIFELIGRLITTLQDLAIDERHTPHLYARFLASLLMRHRKGGGAISGHLHYIPPESQVSHHSQPLNLPPHASLSSSGYSGAAVPGTSQQGHDNNIMQMSLNKGNPTSPPQALTPPSTTTTYRAGDYCNFQPPITTGEVRNEDSDLGMSDVLSENGALAAMHALNDAWWRNMMMPGFSWPEGPHLNGVSEVYNDGIPGIHPGFGGYTAEPQLAV